MTINIEISVLYAQEVLQKALEVRLADINAEAVVGLHFRLRHSTKSMLRIAVQRGDVDGVLRLLQCRYPTGDSRDTLPLLDAAAYGQLDVVRALVETGFPLDSSGFSPLCCAVARGRLKVVEYLLDQGVSQRSTPDGRSPVYLAAANGHLQIMKLLIERGADCSPIFQGSTLLHVAAEHGRLPVVEHLVNCGAPLNAQETDGSTPLFAACVNGHDDVVEYRSLFVKADEI